MLQCVSALHVTYMEVDDAPVVIEQFQEIHHREIAAHTRCNADALEDARYPQALDQGDADLRRAASDYRA